MVVKGSGEVSAGGQPPQAGDDIANRKCLIEKAVRVLVFRRGRSRDLEASEYEMSMWSSNGLWNYTGDFAGRKRWFDAISVAVFRRHLLHLPRSHLPMITSCPGDLFSVASNRTI